MLSNAEADVASTAVSRIAVGNAVDEIQSRAIEIGTSPHQQGELSRQRLKHISARGAGAAQFHIRSKQRNLFEQVRRTGMRGRRVQQG